MHDVLLLCCGKASINEQCRVSLLYAPSLNYTCQHGISWRNATKHVILYLAMYVQA